MGYNTGDKSDSYHIPGRAGTSVELSNSSSDDAFENKNGVDVKNWQVQNTGKVQGLSGDRLRDGGKIIASGEMAYWESAEKYPADDLS